MEEETQAPIMVIIHHLLEISTWDSRRGYTMPVPGIISLTPIIKLTLTAILSHIISRVEFHGRRHIAIQRIIARSKVISVTDCHTLKNKVIYLSIDCLNGTRNDLVPHWGKNFNEPLSDPWDTYNFSSPQIIQAYSNFAIDLISRFNPRYFNYATEISELILNDADKFEQFRIFAAGVYSNLKAAYPSLPLLVSVAFKNPDSADAAIIKLKMAKISDYYDMLGISTYGYIFFDLLANGGNPAYLQPVWLSQAQQIAGEKPMAITETAWIAENYSPGRPFNFTIRGTADFQKDYLDKLFLEANDLDIEFIIWFSIVDYDAWQAVYGNEVSRIWQDTGLYDENLYERPALATWQNWLFRTRK